jgi:hypothetical protein
MGWVVVVVVEGGRENNIEGAAIDSTRYRYIEVPVKDLVMIVHFTYM